MSDQPPPPPAVTVVLPDGRRVPGRLLRRQQQNGAWVFTVALDVPAGAVVPTPGEDYSTVPTVREGGLLLEALRHDKPDARALVLHTAGCWAAPGRLTPATAEDATFFLRHGWATPCDVCRPET